MKCRICDGEIFFLFSINNAPLTDDFLTLEGIGKEFLGKIEIGMCLKCGTVQKINDYDLSDYYKTYFYRTSHSPFVLNFYEKVAEEVSRRVKKSNRKKVLEIGSSTGEFLQFLKKLNWTTVGVEPSLKLTEIALKKDIYTIPDFFNERVATQLLNEFETFDCIVSFYTLDHISELNQTIELIYKLLSPDGILVIEVHDLDLILKLKEFSLFQHEHYFYFDRETLSNFLISRGFEVLSVNFIPDSLRRANSLLVLAKKRESKNLFKVDIQKRINVLIHFQREWKSFCENIDNWLEKHKNNYLIGYGAGGRAVMTLAAIKNYRHLKFLVDKAFGTDPVYTPKTHLPVYGLEILKKEHPDFVLVFSYGYLSEIKSELKKLFEIDEKKVLSLLELS